jgi:cytochrome c
VRRSLAFVLPIAVAVFSIPMQAQAAGDADKGKTVFRQCSVCHSADEGENRVGPSLFGVYGRKAGEAPAFSYSKAVKDSGITWSDENLDKYLTNPQSVIKGTRMAFPGLQKQQDRDDIIAYLKTLK